MPYRSRYSRRGRRSTYKRKARRSRFWRTPVAPKAVETRRFQWGGSANKVNLTYSGFLGAHTLATIRCNSLYDPDYSLGGTYPAGYIPAATGWTKYLVTAALLEVSFTPIQASQAQIGLLSAASTWNSNTPQWFAILKTLTPVATPSLTGDRAWMWDLRGKKVCHSRTRTMGSSSLDAKNVIRLKMWYNAKRDWSLKDVWDSEEDLGAAFGSNPTAQMLWTVVWSPVYTGLDPTPTNVDFGMWSLEIKVSYKATCYDSKQTLWL